MKNIFFQIMTGTETPAAPTGVASIFKRVEQPAVQGWSPTLVRVQSTMHMGHSCKIGNMRCPGTLKNQNPQFEEKNKFFCFFMFLYPIQGGKNNGSPYLTNKSWFWQI